MVRVVDVKKEKDFGKAGEELAFFLFVSLIILIFCFFPHNVAVG